MDNLGSLTQLLAYGAVAYLAVRFIAPHCSNGFKVGSEASKSYDVAYKAAKSSGLSRLEARRSALEEVSYG